MIQHPTDTIHLMQHEKKRLSISSNMQVPRAILSTPFARMSTSESLYMYATF